MNAPARHPISAEAVRLAIAGDAAAFGQLVDAYAGMVTGVAYSVLGDFSRSEDAGQEAFLEAWKRRDTLKDPAKFGSWVCAIARHRALDLVRKNSRPAEGGADLEHVPTASTQPSAEDIAASKEETALVWNSLDSLPEKYREVMVLYYRSEESVAQVAESLGENEATIRQRLVRGRAMLKQEVESIVYKTLRGSSPTAVFTAAVLGSLPGNASAAVAGVTAAGAAGKGGAVATSAAAGAIGGAALGTIGGLIGGGLGTYFAHRNAPFPKQRRLIIRFAVAMIVWTIVFTLLVGWLVTKQLSDAPLDGKTYGVTLLMTIAGFQFTALGLAGWMAWKYRQLGAEARATGEPFHPAIAKRVAAIPRMQARRYTSSASLLGQPILDVQHGAAMIDGTVDDPQTARGWVAIGDTAHGILLGVGKKARGLVAVGGFCFGGVTIGGIGFGLVNLCGLSIGLFSLGGLAIGWLALGGLSLGVNAVGGLAAGVHAVGGAAFGWQHADGGLAWSHSSAVGGVVLGGETGEAASADIASHWFMAFSKNFLTGSGSVGLSEAWWQVVAVSGFALLLAAGTGFVWYSRIQMPSMVQPKSNSTESVDPQKLANNDIGAYFGGLIGCTAWMLGLNEPADSVWIAGMPLAVYLAGAALCAWYYFNHRGLAHVLSVQLTACGITAVTLTLMIVWHGWGAGRESVAGLWIPTLAIMATLTLSAHAAIAMIMAAARQKVSSNP